MSATASATTGDAAERARVERILAARLLMSKREAAREAHNFLLADEVRTQLGDLHGVEVFDQKDGPSGWKFRDGTSKKLPTGTALPAEIVAAARSKEKDNDNKSGKKESKKRSADGDSRPASSSSAQSSGSNNNTKQQSQGEQQAAKKLKAQTPAASSSSSSSSRSLSTGAISQKVSALAAKEKEQQRAALQAVVGTAANVKTVEGIRIEVTNWSRCVAFVIPEVTDCMTCRTL
jgi:cobalamin biosynthesis Mg chelatase CobN